MKPWWLGRIAKGVVIAAVAIVAFGSVVMLLWNALIPDIFGGPVLSFWQALGLLVLAHILTRGGGRWHYAYGWRHERWRRKFEEKLAAMTPEEREKFREEWRHKCGPRWKEAEESPSGAKA